MKTSVVRKAVWYAILCGLSAMMPEVIAAVSSAEAISQIPWMEILDQKGVMFVTAALSGLGIGGAKAGFQGRTKPGVIRPVALLSVFMLMGCGAHYNITRVGPDGTKVVATASVSEEQGSMSFTFDGDPSGQMTITLDKTNAKPVNMPAETMRTLLGMRE
jgi:hypothetical protein